MSSVYIIKFTINDNSNEVEAFLELSKNTNDHPIIQVRTHEKSSHDDNQVLLYKYISNDFAKVSFSSTDDRHECLLNYVDKNNYEYNTRFYFDSQSTSAFTDFKQTFTNMINTMIDTINYPSGYLYYFGETIDNDTMKQPCGTGTTHYDTAMRKIKYVGEFENGKYDGAGEFFSYDNKISIKANNISNGIPTQNGILKINLGVKSITYDIDFDYLFESFNLTDKKDKRFFVKSDIFVKNVADLYWTDEESIDSVMFREKSINDKHIEIWNQIQKLNNKIESLSVLNESLNMKTTQLNNLTAELCVYTLSSVFFILISLIWLL